MIYQQLIIRYFSMISKENIEEIKEMLYMNCLSKQFCCLCMERIEHKDHCIHTGSLKIGSLDRLRFLINNIINDTSEQRFRLYEACRFLESQGYITYKIPTSKMCATIFYCTPKLIIEMREKQSKEGNEEQKQLWY